MNPTPQPATYGAVYRFLQSTGGYQPAAHNNPVRPLAHLRPGLTLGHLTVLAIVGEHVYLRQAFRTNVTRRWKLHTLSAFRHNRPRRWPYHLTPVRMPIESVLRIMRDEKGRWGAIVSAPLTAIEARFIEAGGVWDWSGEGKLVCRYRRTSRRGKERKS